MAKPIKIPLTIQGLKQAKEDLQELNKEFDKVKDDPIESKKIAKEFNELSKAIDGTTEQLLEMNKAGQLVGTKFDDLNEVLFDTKEEVLPLTSQIGEMEDRMYQLAAAGDTSSKEFKSLQAETVRLRQVIRQTDKDVDLLAENKGLSVFAEGWSQVGTSIMSLNFEQAAIDAKNLDAQVGNLGKMGAKSIKGLISTVGTLSKTFIKFGISLLANPIFLIVAAVTAIVVGIGFLLHKMGLLKKAFDILAAPVMLIIDGFKALTDALGFTANAEEKAIAASKKRDAAIVKNIAKLEAKAAAEKRLHDQVMSQLESEKALIEARGGNVEKVNARIDKANIKQLESEKNNFLQRKALELKRLEEQELRLKKQAEAEARGVKKFKGSSREYQKQIAINSARRRQLANKDYAKLVEIENKIDLVRENAWNRQRERLTEIEAEYDTKRSERLEKYKEYQQRRLDAARQLEDLEIDLMKEGTEKTLAELNLKYDRLIEDTLSNEQLLQEEKDKMTKYYESLRAAEEGKVLLKQQEDEKKALAEKAKAEEEALQKQYAREDEQYALLNQLRETEEEREITALVEQYEAKFALAQGNAELEKALEEEQKKALADINDKYRKEEEAKTKAVQDAKLNMAIEGLSLISSATELFGKKNEKNAKRAFEVNKAAQIAQAVISTYQGANAIFASAAANPATVLFPAQPFIAAGLAIANGLVNVAKITQTKFEGGSAPSSGGGGSAPSIGGSQPSASRGSSPSFNLFGQGNNLDEASSTESVDTTQNIQVQAVVSETEVTQTQQNVAQMQLNAEL